MTYTLRDYKETAHGVTAQSKKYLSSHLRFIGPVSEIRSIVDEDGETWVRFIGSRGSVTVNGFSWGYWGEGPAGLSWASNLVGIPLSRADIVRLVMVREWSRKRRQHVAGR